MERRYMEFQIKYPTKEEKENALKEMSKEEIDELIEVSKKVNAMTEEKMFKDYEEGSKICITGNSPEEKVQKLIEYWTVKKNDYIDEWCAMDKEFGNGGWPAKYVKTKFILDGQQFVINPDTIGLDPFDSWDQGFLEYIQGLIEHDLEKMGATNIYSTGFLD